MWKISVVMLVTTIFAGLLIYNPHELPSKNVALPIDVPPSPANVVPTPAQAEAVLAMEVAPTTIRGLRKRSDSSGVVGALPDKSVASFALQPLQASNRFQKQPVLQTAAQIPVVQHFLGKRKTYRAEEGRRRETRWIENARDSRNPQHSKWRCHSCGRPPQCDYCH